MNSWPVIVGSSGLRSWRGSPGMRALTKHEALLTLHRAAGACKVARVLSHHTGVCLSKCVCLRVIVYVNAETPISHPTAPV